MSSELYMEPDVSHVYIEQDPTRTVHFFVAVGEAHKFNPEADKLVLCIGNAQNIMEVEK